MDTVIKAGLDEFTIKKTRKIVFVVFLLSLLVVNFAKNEGVVELGIIVMLLSILLVFLSFMSHNLGTVFIFKSTGMYISSPTNGTQEWKTFVGDISYSEFSAVYLDIDDNLYLKTESQRIKLKMKIPAYFSKDKIQQLLKEFQKRGKQVLLASELTGIYEI